MFTRIILYLYLTEYYLRPTSWAPAIGGIRILFYLGILGILLVLYSFLIKKNKNIYDNVDALILLLFFVMLTSRVMMGWLGGTISLFFKLLPSILAYYLVTISCNTPKKLDNLLIYLILLVTFIAWQVEVQMQTGTAVGNLHHMWRRSAEVVDGIQQYKPQAVWHGVFNDPNDLGMALTVMVPLIINKIQQGKLLYTFPLALILNAIYYTNSRGTILSLIVSLSLYFVLCSRNLKGLMIGGILGLIIIVLGPSRVAQMNVDGASSQGRLEAWTVALRLFKSDPIFGVGAKTFTDYHTKTAHNSYLLLLSETGFFGLMFFLGVLGVPIYSAIRIIFAEDDIKKRSSNAALTAGFSGLCFSIMLLSRPYTLLPYLYAALTITYLRVHYSEKLKEIVSGIKYRYLIVATVLQILMFYIMVRVLQFH